MEKDEEMGDRPIRVSIVVPFYNLEKYAQACIESLLSQTYDYFELILVNDGSTDNTRQILDLFADHPKVRVFHKTNGGLSSARNYGVDKASYEYVSFVDGDDVVVPRYLEQLVKGCDGASRTIVTMNPAVLPQSEVPRFLSNSDSACFQYRELLPEDAMEEVLYGSLTTSACAKLAPISLYKELPFPNGYYEEISTIAMHIFWSDKIVVADPSSYGYVMRSGSIVNRKRSNQKQVSDYFVAVERLGETVQNECDSSMGNALAYRESLEYTRIYMLLHVAEIDDAMRCSAETYLINEVRRKFLSLISNRKINLASKLRLALFSCAPKLYAAFMNEYNRKKKEI